MVGTRLRRLGMRRTEAKPERNIGMSALRRRVRSTTRRWCEWNRDGPGRRGKFDPRRRAGHRLLCQPSASVSSSTEKFFLRTSIHRRSRTGDVCTDSEPTRLLHAKSSRGDRHSLCVHLSPHALPIPTAQKDMDAAHTAKDTLRSAMQRWGVGGAQVDRPVQGVRDVHLESLVGLVRGAENAFGTKEQVSPLDYVVGAAVGWGGIRSMRPKQHHGASETQ